MREIKFRAWDKKTKTMLTDEWIQTLDLSFEGQWEVYISGGIRQYLSGIDLGHQIKFKGCELMQYTGLHDCNGKEIYEGDIVQDEMADGRNIWAIITCDPEQWEEPFCYGNDNAFCYKGFLELIARERIEVIGNIYMNPELVGNL